MHPRVRALGQALIYALLVFVAFPAQGRWLASRLHGAGGLALYLVGHLAQLAEILVFGGAAAALEKRPFAAFGLPWREALRSRFWLGAGAGVVALSALVLALGAAGALRLQLAARPPLVAAAYGLAYALVFVLLAAREEFLYRGYGQAKLAAAAGFWPAAMATTAWFTATHLPGGRENMIGLANLALFGLVACLTLQRTGSLWLAIGYHAAWDWGETYLFGVADSGHDAAPGHLFTASVPASAPAWLAGGTVGPEGSVLCVALLALVGVACVRWLRPRTGGTRPAAT